MGPGRAMKVSRWLATWGERDPAAPHSHLGPVAVEPPLRGHGVGSQLMGEYCRRLDSAGEASYLETDKRANVPFYERHGYVLVGEGEVIGVPNWFMSRHPRHAASHGGASPA